VRRACERNDEIIAQWQGRGPLGRPRHTAACDRRLLRSRIWRGDRLLRVEARPSGRRTRRAAAAL